jgi:predicted CxxxxCH...CXXCH cytochrome family protein
MQDLRIATLSLAALLAAAACGSSREAGAAGATVTVPSGGPGGGVLTLSVDTCTPCHGDRSRSTAGADALVQLAPPRAPSGDPADPAIGAHLAHLTDGPLARAVACSSCHFVPSSPTGHRAPTVSFSGLAATSWPGAPAIAPSYAAGSCSATYCHGAFPNGAAANVPRWDGAPAQCGSCHAIPPTTVSQGGTHPDVEPANCARCHPGYTATTVDASLHVNGAVDTAFTCTSCHGDASRAGTDAGSPPVALAPAPPTDSRGASSGAAVGAHLRHLVAPIFSRPVNCEECHGVIPTSADHADGTVQVTFGALANTGGAAPTWNPATVTCASTYCHGSFTNGNGANPISWTTGSAACGTCHGFPPGGTHVNRLDCDSCHPPRVNGLPDSATHVNGVVDVH